MKNHLFYSFFLILTSFSSLTAKAETGSLYKRDLIQENNRTYYIVGPRAPHLFMISRDLYGDEKNWREIAHWNSLIAPYKLEIGQRLLIKKDPTQNEHQANRALVKAWTELQEWDRVEGIALSEAPAVTPTPRSQVTENLIEERHSEPPAGLPPPPEKKSESAEKNPELPHQHWGFEIAAIGSIARLESQFSDSGIDNILNTEIDYGVDATLISHFANERGSLFVNAAIEKMDIKPPNEGVEMEGETQTLSHYALGYGYEFTSKFSASLSAIYDEEAFGESTPDGVAVVKIGIPQIALGPGWKIIDGPRFESEIKLAALYSFAARKNETRLHEGYGALLELELRNHFAHGDIVYAVMGRYLEQKGDNLKTKQSMGLAKLGWAW